MSVFHALSHYCKAIKSNVVLVATSKPLAFAMHWGLWGNLCGESNTNQINVDPNTAPVANPVSDNVTQLHLTWTYMVIHIKVLTMAEPYGGNTQGPKGDTPERPVSAPRAIQLTVK